MNNREIRRHLSQQPLKPATRDWYRAAGDCLCECGHEYRLHPLDTDDEFFHVLCNGDRVKL